MQMFDLSIIIPVYNQERYLDRIFLSLQQEQPLSSYEVIFIDDGSQDTSAHLIKQFQKQNPLINVNYYYKINGGVSSARNYGITHAKGKYIWFVDPDDTIIIKNLDNFISDLTINESDLLMFGFEIKDEATNSNIIIEYDNRKFIALEDFTLLSKKHLISAVWNKIIKREFITEHNLKFDELINFGEDFLFIITIFSNSNNIIMSNLVSYHYYINSNSLSKKVIPDLTNLRIRIWDQYINYEKKTSIDIKELKDLFIIETFTSCVSNNIKNQTKRPVYQSYLEIKTILDNIENKKIDSNFENKKYNLMKFLINLGLYRTLIFILYSIKR